MLIFYILYTKCRPISALSPWAGCLPKIYFLALEFHFPKILTLVHKALHGLAPESIQELLTVYHPHRSLQSGDKNLLVVPFARSTMVHRHVFSSVGPKLWNDLPLSLRSVSSYPEFKKLLKTFLFTSYFKNQVLCLLTVNNYMNSFVNSVLEHLWSLRYIK